MFVCKNKGFGLVYVFDSDPEYGGIEWEVMGRDSRGEPVTRYVKTERGDVFKWSPKRDFRIRSVKVPQYFWIKNRVPRLLTHLKLGRDRS